MTRRIRRVFALRLARTSALVVVLASSGALPGAAQDVPVVVPERDLVLGGIDVAEWQAFSRPPRVVPLGDGAAVLRSPGEPFVVVVDGAGRFVRQIGRQGQGPGEFTGVVGVGMFADTLWLRDWSPPRASFFDVDGTLLETVAASVEYAERFTGPQGITSFLEGGGFVASPDAGVVGAGERSTVPVVFGSRTNGTLDTVATRVTPEGMVVREIGYFAYTPIRRPPILAIDPHGRGFAVVRWEDDRSSGVDVEWFDSSGRPARRYTVPHETQVLANDVRRRLVAEGVELAEEPYLAARQRGDPVPRDLEDAVRDGLDLPRHWPPITDVFVSSLGHLWLRTTPQNGDHWIVLDRTGSPLIVVEEPDGVRFQAADGGWVWGTWTDEFDVPYVGRFSITP
ncbi:MAG: hypothetical protein AAF389_03610 [Gemmatimonadota bacterium]